MGYYDFDETIGYDPYENVDLWDDDNDFEDGEEIEEAEYEPREDFGWFGDPALCGE